MFCDETAEATIIFFTEKSINVSIQLQHGKCDDKIQMSSKFFSLVRREIKGDVSLQHVQNTTGVVLSSCGCANVIFRSI